MGPGMVRIRSLAFMDETPLGSGISQALIRIGDGSQEYKAKNALRGPTEGVREFSHPAQGAQDDQIERGTLVSALNGRPEVPAP